MKGKTTTSEKNSSSPDKAILAEYIKRLDNPHLAIEPSNNATDTISHYSNKTVNASLPQLTQRIREQMALVNQGDMSVAEDMLVAQANTLDVIFNQLAQKSARIPIDNLTQVRYMETLLRLALKAQSQCRTTLETLAVIKRPPQVTFTKQQNVAYQQQVNNGGRVSSRVEESNISSNELLEGKHGERLECGAKAAASRANTPMEALGVLNRPQDKSRQGKVESKRV